MEILDTKNVNEKEIICNIIQCIDTLLNEWKKMPDSWIEPEDYANSEHERKAKNKFRAIYFQKIIAELGLLAEYLPKIEKEKLENDLAVLSDKQRKFIEGGKVPEYIIDEMDNFAKKIIEKYRIIGE